MQSVEGREAEFARRLSVSDKVSRDRALKKLRTWLHARSQPSAGDFVVEDMMKLWRGLYYCMWMSDKPIVQEECALNISSLVHSMATSFCALQFVDCGWLTICQEWHNIDRLRMDKFLMLMRHYLRQSFMYLQKHHWNSELVTEMMENLSIGVLHPTTDEVPVGVQLHLTDIYVPVLEDVAKKEAIPWTVLQQLLQPILGLAAKTDKPVVLKGFCSGVGDSLLALPSVHSPDIVDEESMEEEEEGPREVSALKVDHGAAAEILFALGSEASVSQRNRSTLYLYKRRFESIAVANVPVSSAVEPTEEAMDEAMAERDVSAAEPMEEVREEVTPVKRRKKRRRKLSDEGTGTLSASDTPATPGSSQVTPGGDNDGRQVKKKKIRLSLESNQIKQFSKKDPIDVSPWKPSSKGGKSLLKNRTPTPITPKMKRILAQSKAKAESQCQSLSKSPS